MAGCRSAKERFSGRNTPVKGNASATIRRGQLRQLSAPRGACGLAANGDVAIDSWRFHQLCCDATLWLGCAQMPTKPPCLPWMRNTSASAQPACSHLDIGLSCYSDISGWRVQCRCPDVALIFLSVSSSGRRLVFLNQSSLHMVPISGQESAANSAALCHGISPLIPVDNDIAARSV